MTLCAADAQPAEKVYCIGLLGPTTAASTAEFRGVFRQELQDLGWVEGQHIAWEYRYAEGTLDRLPDLTATLGRLPVDLLVTVGLASTLAAQHATTTIPIVFLGVGNPVGNGLVAGLTRPGGNLTGIAFDVGPGLMAKQLELLKDAVPTVSRVAMLIGQVRSPTREAEEQTRERAAQMLGLTFRHFYVVRPEEWTARVFPALTADTQASDALYASGPVTMESCRHPADFALQHRLALFRGEENPAWRYPALARGHDRLAIPVGQGGPGLRLRLGEDRLRLGQGRGDPRNPLEAGMGQLGQSIGVIKSAVGDTIGWAVGGVALRNMGTDTLPKHFAIITVATQGLLQQRDPGLMLHEQCHHHLVEVRAMIPTLAWGNVRDLFVGGLIAVIAAIDMETRRIERGERGRQPQPRGRRGGHEAIECGQPSLGQT